MIKKLHPTVEFILEQRYQNKFLLEKEELAVVDRPSKGKAPSDIRKKLGQGLMDVADASGYTEFAYENVPGVKGMAQVEVPLAKTDRKAYEAARSELAKQIVLSRKNAFDQWRQGDREDRELTPEEELKAALGAAPELVDVLTRDEYELLAGDITNPLNLEVPVKVKGRDSAGNETEAEKLETLSREKWGGIEGGGAALYDFLRGAQESLTTPEGLAMAAAGGAAFKGAGALLGAGGKYVVSPLVARTLGKAAAKALPSAQNVTNLAGLGLVGLGLAGAAAEGKAAKFAGELAGGVAPFAAGREGAGLAGRVAKEAATQTGKVAVKAAKAVSRPVADIATDFIETQKSPEGFVGQAKQLPGWLADLIKGTEVKRMTASSSGEWQNLSPAEQMARWQSGEGTWTPGQPFEPHVSTVRSPTTRTETPSSLRQQAAKAALALTLGLSGVPKTAAEVSVPPRSPAMVETMPIEAPRTGAPRTEAPSGGSEPTSGTARTSTETPSVESSPTKPKISQGEPYRGIQVSKTSDKTTSKELDKISKAKKDNKKDSKHDGSTDQNKIPDTNKNTQNNNTTIRDTIQNTEDTVNKTISNDRGKGGGSDKTETRKTEKFEKEIKGEGGIPPFTLPSGGYDQAPSSVLDDYMRNLKSQADVNAYIDRFYNVAQTIRLQ